MGRGKEQVGVTGIYNLHTNVWGNFRRIVGDVSGLTGDVSGLVGCMSDIEGDATGEKGKVIVGDAGARIGDSVTLYYWDDGRREVISNKLRFRRAQPSREEVEARRWEVEEIRRQNEHKRQGERPHWKEVVYEGARDDPNPDAHWKSKVGLDD